MQLHKDKITKAANCAALIILSMNNIQPIILRTKQFRRWLRSIAIKTYSYIKCAEKIQSIFLFKQLYNLFLVFIRSGIIFAVIIIEHTSNKH
jgi:hypothetical protein